MGDQVVNTVDAIVESYARKMGDAKKVFFRPNIPSNKLHNAIGAYAPGVAAADALVLVDDTLGGGAKEGALLTSTTLYSHNINESPGQVSIGDIDALSLQEKAFSKGVLLVNGARFLDMTCPSRPEQRLLTSMLEEIVHQRHSLEDTNQNGGGLSGPSAPYAGDARTDEGQRATRSKAWVVLRAVGSFVLFAAVAWYVVIEWGC